MIYVFGMGGGSTALADEMRFRLVRLGRPVATYQDGLLQRMVASTVSRECVVIALSTTGRVPEMVENCKIARSYGARIGTFAWRDDFAAGHDRWSFGVGHRRVAHGR